MQRQLQAETRNIEVLAFGASYIRGFTVVGAAPTGEITGWIIPLFLKSAEHFRSHKLQNRLYRTPHTLTWRARYRVSFCGWFWDSWWDSTVLRVIMRLWDSTVLRWFFSTNIEWDVPDFVMNSRNSSVTTNELRFQVAGNLASTQDFYLFTEFMVFGVYVFVQGLMTRFALLTFCEGIPLVTIVFLRKASNVRPLCFQCC